MTTDTIIGTITLSNPIEKPILKKLSDINERIVIIHIGNHSIKFHITEAPVIEYTITVFPNRFPDEYQYTENTFSEKIDPDIQYLIDNSKNTMQDYEKISSAEELEK